ncbi:MAG: class I SAM-dependent methyltransferase [Bacteroidia bacterium]
MKIPGFLQKIISLLKPAITPQMLAKHLRQPKGKFGEVVGKKMNESNGFLYDFVLDAMQIEDNNSIMEIGFGNGKFFEKIFSRAKNLKIAGIDFSETMVKVAEKTNDAAISDDSLDLWHGDCDVLPFDYNSFDKVFCINVAYFWQNPTDNLMEIHRVLKPGGKFYTGIRHKDSMKYMPFTQYGFTMYDEESWKHQLVKNLFNFIEVKTIEEPPIEFNGEYFSPKSLCFVAQKPF